MKLGRSVAAELAWQLAGEIAPGRAGVLAGAAEDDEVAVRRSLAAEPRPWIVPPSRSNVWISRLDAAANGESSDRCAAEKCPTADPSGPSSSSAYAVWRSPFRGSSPARRSGRVGADDVRKSSQLGCVTASPLRAADECFTAPPSPSTPAATRSPRPSRPRRDETLEPPPYPHLLVETSRPAAGAAGRASLDGTAGGRSNVVARQPLEFLRVSCRFHRSRARARSSSATRADRGARRGAPRGGADRARACARCSASAAAALAAQVGIGRARAPPRGRRAARADRPPFVLELHRTGPEADGRSAPLPLARVRAARPRRARAARRRAGARPDRPARRGPRRLRPPRYAAARRTAGLRRRRPRPVAHALAPDGAAAGRDGARRRHRLGRPGDPGLAAQRDRVLATDLNERALTSPRSTPRSTASRTSSGGAGSFFEPAAGSASGSSPATRRT